MYKEIAFHWVSIDMKEKHTDDCWKYHASCAIEFLYKHIKYLEGELKDRGVTDV